MKIIILKHSEGEYDMYEELIDEILMVNEDLPSVELLYNTLYTNYMLKQHEKFTKDYLKTHKKSSDSEWRKHCISENLNFSSWLKQNYFTTRLPFDMITL